MAQAVPNGYIDQFGKQVYYAPPTTPTSEQNPVDYSQLLNSGQNYLDYMPAAYSQFGATPQVQAAQTQAAQVNPTNPFQAATVDNSQMAGALSQYQAMNAQGLAPTFQNQQDQLDSSLAQRGIFNSTAGQELQNDLSGQQAAALAQQNAPLTQQFAGYYNSNNQLNAANQQSANAANYAGQQSDNQLNANLIQNTNLANQGSQNNANQYNASAYGVVTAGDMQNYNTYLNSLYGADQAQRTALLNGTLGSYDPATTGQSQIAANGAYAGASAYTNAFQNGAAGTANLASSFGQIGQQIANGIDARKAAGSYSGPDSANSSYGDY